MWAGGLMPCVVGTHPPGGVPIDEARSFREGLVVYVCACAPFSSLLRTLEPQWMMATPSTRRPVPSHRLRMLERCGFRNLL